MAKSNTTQKKISGVGDMPARKCLCGNVIIESKKLRTTVGVEFYTKPSGNMGARKVKKHGCVDCVSLA